jgi:hypothetical protein
MVEKGLTEKIFFAGKKNMFGLSPMQEVWISCLEVALDFPPSLLKISCLDYEK